MTILDLEMLKKARKKEHIFNNIQLIATRPGLYDVQGMETISI